MKWTPGLDDDVGLALGCHARQGETVPPQVAHAVEDVGRHVVVGENDRVLLFLELVDRMDQGGLGRPFHRRDDVLHAVVEMIRGGPDLVRIRQFRPVLIKALRRTVPVHSVHSVLPFAQYEQYWGPKSGGTLQEPPFCSK